MDHYLAKQDRQQTASQREYDLFTLMMVMGQKYGLSAFTFIAVYSLPQSAQDAMLKYYGVVDTTDLEVVF